MKIYAILNPMIGVYSKTELLADAIDMMAEISFNFYMKHVPYAKDVLLEIDVIEKMFNHYLSHTHNSPVSVVTKYDDMTDIEIWQCLNVELHYILDTTSGSLLHEALRIKINEYLINN